MSPLLRSEGGWYLSAEGDRVVEHTTGLLVIPAKLVMLANDLIMLLKLTVLAVGTGVALVAGFNSAAAGFSTALAGPAKPDLWVLLAILSMEGGGDEVGGVSFPVLVVMISLTPTKVGKKAPCPDPTQEGRGGAPSPEKYK